MFFRDIPEFSGIFRDLFQFSQKYFFRNRTNKFISLTTSKNEKENRHPRLPNIGSEFEPA